MKFKRRIALVCCLLTVNLLLAPVAHAAMTSLGDAGTAMQHAGIDCERALLERLDPLDDAEAAISTGSSDCKLGANCNFLCGLATTDAQTVAFSAAGFDRSGRWSLADLSAFESSCLPRLERPPRQ